MIGSPPTNPIFNQTNIEMSMNVLNTASEGPDGIIAMLLKSAWLDLSTTFTQLFNDWLAIGFVPKQSYCLDHSYCEN